MSQPLMPKATAVWLVDNTTLTFQQIAEFCGLHPLEIQGIADGEVAIGIQGMDPINNAELTKEEITRCEGDPTAKLKAATTTLPKPSKRTKGPRYTPVAKRQDKPDGVAWLLRHHPELKESQIAKLIGTTKNTIQAISDRSHWNSANIRPRDPVLLGLCNQTDLNAAVAKARKAAEKAGIVIAQPEPEPEAPSPSSSISLEGFGLPSND
ncbi:MAG: cell cycle transcriptional regulator TrcR [Pseudomonadota bacterium]